MTQSEILLDIMKEVINVGLGEAADALSNLVNTRVMIKVPDMHIMDIDEVRPYIRKEMTSLGVYISQDFKGGIKGKTILCYSRECGVSLLNTIYGDTLQVSTITESGISTLNEIGNIIMVSYMSAVSNFIDDKIRFELPEVTQEISETYFENLLTELKPFDKAIVVKNRMYIKEENLEGYLFVMLSFKDFTTVVETLQTRMMG
ncbi:Chemotaxis protein CheY-P-specific phosphatase CheC [Desulfocicer vacuolatum DSM 3385]|uniref:Chemotaxis protein CheY-P-specific phosphatase CheC n=1 Tax=Desulfocicer vacuolatum DSM 3385 TaxID=1121400 RepID=A0A1W2BEQ8_9BACT|nr:chemotaxis protein CheC [Desulfocicer vacuolatum]SMC71202.1 Chemotaxis protein CheY-P-specific phosphatase CheC [Desulfocicer vacuolatum DSM 3385]